MSQGSTQVPTTGPVSPTVMAGDINTAMAALGSNSSGGSSPTNGVASAPYGFQWWVDTTDASNVVLKMYDGASWVALATLDTVNHLWKSISAGLVYFTGVITPTALAANTDDWTPTNLGLASRIRISGGANTTNGINIGYNLTGITGGSSGRMLILDNVGSYNITLKNNVTSTAAYRFQLARDYVLKPDTSVTLIYDATSSRWRIPGAYLPTYPTLTSITATGAGTYYTPAGATRLRVRYVGGGGGGGNRASANGSVGVKTTFNGVDAAPGNGGTGATPGTSNVAGVGGAGGTGGAGSATIRFPGQAGQDGQVAVYASGLYQANGGNGGSSAFWGGGGMSGTAKNGVANSGGGGAGEPYGTNAQTASPGGGGAGECVELWINAPAASYAYSVGTGGAAGTGAGNPGAGAAGRILIEEFYD